MNKKDTGNILYYYTKCNRCGSDMKPNTSTICGTCRREYYRAYRLRKKIEKQGKELEARIEIEALKEQVRMLQEQLLLLQNQVNQLLPKLSDKRLLNKRLTNCTTCGVSFKEVKNGGKGLCKNCYHKNYHRIKYLNQRIKRTGEETGDTVDMVELMKFIEPIVKRNHNACFEELFKIIDYHDRLFAINNTGPDAIYKMYKDLVWLYKEQKMALGK